MKKLFSTFLIIMLFVGIGMAQSSTDKTTANQPTKATSKSSTLAPIVISTAERAYMENLKKTDVEAYKIYLQEQIEIRTYEKQLSDNKEMDATLKAKITARLNELKSTHTF